MRYSRFSLCASSRSWRPPSYRTMTVRCAMLIAITRAANQEPTAAAHQMSSSVAVPPTVPACRGGVTAWGVHESQIATGLASVSGAILLQALVQSLPE